MIVEDAMLEIELKGMKIVVGMVIVTAGARTQTEILKEVEVGKGMVETSLEKRTLALFTRIESNLLSPVAGIAGLVFNNSPASNI